MVDFTVKCTTYKHELNELDGIHEQTDLIPENDHNDPKQRTVSGRC